MVVVIGSTEGETILAMNNGREPFNNIEVRRAISYAVNRDEVIAGASNGLGTPIGSHFSPANAAYVDLTGTYSYDPERAKELLANSQLPDSVKALLQRVITFLDGSGGGGPDLPDPNAVPISQFLYPSIGKDCIRDGGDSIGTALAVAGPAPLPPPGPKAGQAGFVFTALGTAKFAAQQAQPLTVSWINVSNGQDNGNE